MIYDSFPLLRSSSTLFDRASSFLTHMAAREEIQIAVGKVFEKLEAEN